MSKPDHDKLGKKATDENVVQTLRKKERVKKEQDKKLNEQLEESLPASDPSG